MGKALREKKSFVWRKQFDLAPLFRISTLVVEDVHFSLLHEWGISFRVRRDDRDQRQKGPSSFNSVSSPSYRKPPERPSVTDAMKFFSR